MELLIEILSKTVCFFNVFLPLRDTGAIRRLAMQRLHYDKGTGLSSGRRCIARELLDGSTARERGT